MPEHLADRVAEQVRNVPVVELPHQLVQIALQVLHVDPVALADQRPLEQTLDALNAVGVVHAPHRLFLAAIDSFGTRVLVGLPVEGVDVQKPKA